MDTLRITVGRFRYVARLEGGDAPQTCAAFLKLLPFKQKIIQARWSGEAAWVPLGEFQVGVGFENHTSYPAPGEILLYPGGYSETEILFPYGPTCFGESLPDDRGGARATARDGPGHRLGGGAGHPLRGE